MLTAHDIQRLIQHGTNGGPVISLLLDMSVNSDNKRTFQVFLNKERSRFAELDSDPEGRRETIGAALQRMDAWLAEGFDEANRGVALYTSLDGDWFDAIQFPVPVRNRFEIRSQPVIGPLTELLRVHRPFAAAVVDREHLWLIAGHMGVVLAEERVQPDPLPMPADVQAGGYSHKDYQKRKAEEARHFFKDFAATVSRFDQRLHPEVWVLMGTQENVQHFREFLAHDIAQRVSHTSGSPAAQSAAEIATDLTPVFQERALRDEADTLTTVRERVRRSHFAIGGVHGTLEQLQEGKVGLLVLARDLARDGAQCQTCRFYLADPDSACPYCGGPLRDGIDIVESMIQIATRQEIPVEFVAADAMNELDGVGALLKF